MAVLFDILVSPEMYAHMTHHLSALANGKIIVILEGGYNLNAISLSMTLCTKTLLGDPLPPLAPYKPPIASAVETIQKVICEQSRYWSKIKAFSCKFPKNKNIEIIWETACSPQATDKLIKSEDSNLLDDKMINESLPILPSASMDINVLDDCVKDSEYIPFQFGGSITVAGVNTISNQIRSKETEASNIVIDSSDYEQAKRFHSTSKTIKIPTTLTNQLVRMKITHTTDQAASMPEFTAVSEGHAKMLQSGIPNAHSKNEYIPFQYGSYQESSSVYTYTEAESFRNSKTENTVTTDSKSNILP